MLVLDFILPEITMLLGASTVMLQGVFFPSRRLQFMLSKFFVLLAAVFTLPLLDLTSTLVFDGHFVLGKHIVKLKMLSYAFTFLFLLYTSAAGKKDSLVDSDYLALILFAVLGMMLLISAGSTLNLYLGLELLSLPLYALVAINKNSTLSAEASIKYLVTGAVASGMLLYGISILYGATHSLKFMDIYRATMQEQANMQLLGFAMLFVLAGTLFKMGLVPFHMWVPDVYQGAATSSVLFLSIAPKFAVLALLMQVLLLLFPDAKFAWQGLILVMGLISIIVGSFLAVAQFSVKRMLAYSSVANMGFVLLAMTLGYSAFSIASYYLAVYLLSLMGVLGIFFILELRDETFAKKDITLLSCAGLSIRSPFLAMAMLVYLFSLAGVPPFIGFYAKLFLLSGLVDANLLYVAIVAVIFSVVGAFYYLRVIKFVYFEPAKSNEVITLTSAQVFVICVNLSLILGLSLFPAV